MLTKCCKQVSCQSHGLQGKQGGATASSRFSLSLSLLSSSPSSQSLNCSSNHQNQNMPMSKSWSKRRPSPNPVALHCAGLPHQSEGVVHRAQSHHTKVNSTTINHQISSSTPSKTSKWLVKWRPSPGRWFISWETQAIRYYHSVKCFAISFSLSKLPPCYFLSGWRRVACGQWTATSWTIEVSTSSERLVRMM